MNATTVKLSVRQWALEDRPSNKLQNLGTAALSELSVFLILNCWPSSLEVARRR